MYRPQLSRREKKKLLHYKWLLALAAVLLAALVVWQAWVRPIAHGSNVRSFEECVQGGNVVQETYPEVCLTKDGKRFVNPTQQKAHQESLANKAIVPPSDPAQLKLDIEEWGVRIPLTMDTFDLTYSYFDNGEGGRALFSYKRLIAEGICAGDVGLTLTRSYALNQPPFTKDHPAPLAQVDKWYFYPAYAEKPCYDTNNAQQSALVKQITGSHSITETTATLAAKLAATPK